MTAILGYDFKMIPGFSSQNDVTYIKDPELGSIVQSTSDEVITEKLRKKIRELKAQVDDLGDLADELKREYKSQKEEIKILKDENIKKTDMLESLEKKISAEFHRRGILI